MQGDRLDREGMVLALDARAPEGEQAKVPGIARLSWNSLCATRPFVLLPVLGLVGANALARSFVEPPRAAILPQLVPAPRLPDAIRLQKTSIR